MAADPVEKGFWEKRDECWANISDGFSGETVKLRPHVRPEVTTEGAEVTDYVSIDASVVPSCCG